MNNNNLGGKEVRYRMMGHIYTGIVVACVEDVGVTIVNKEDEDDFIICLNLPKSPLYSGEGSAVTPLLYEVYDYIVYCTENGENIIGSVIENIVGRVGATAGKYPSRDSCPFNS